MKKIIAMSMSLVLTAGIFTGCSREPGKKDTLRRLEDVCGGENIEIVYDGRARSLDRDLEFTYSYDWEGTPIWPDIDLSLGGKYILESDYDYAVHKYWNDEYRRCIEKYNFAEVDYGRDADEEIFLSPNAVYIYIEDGASEEDLKNVESLLLDLRKSAERKKIFTLGIVLRNSAILHTFGLSTVMRKCIRKLKVSGLRQTQKTNIFSSIM